MKRKKKDTHPNQNNKASLIRKGSFGHQINQGHAAVRASECQDFQQQTQDEQTTNNEFCRVEGDVEECLLWLPWHVLLPVLKGKKKGASMVEKLTAPGVRSGNEGCKV